MPGIESDCAEVSGRSRECPAFAGCYNEDSGIVCYFNAGHTPGLVRDRSGCSELPATGLPLGLFSHVACEAPMVALEPERRYFWSPGGLSKGCAKGRPAAVKSLVWDV